VHNLKTVRGNDLFHSCFVLSYPNTKDVKIQTRIFPQTYDAFNRVQNNSYAVAARFNLWTGDYQSVRRRYASLMTSSISPVAAAIKN
jgi:hypothetical protein